MQKTGEQFVGFCYTAPMTKQLSLKILLALGLGGMAFSGYLSYLELIAKTAAMCPAPGAPGTIFGYPACVYGFVMYACVTAVSIAGLRSRG